MKHTARVCMIHWTISGSDIFDRLELCLFCLKLYVSIKSNKKTRLWSSKLTTTHQILVASGVDKYRILHQFSHCRYTFSLCPWMCVRIVCEWSPTTDNTIRKIYCVYEKNFFLLHFSSHVLIVWKRTLDNLFLTVVTSNSDIVFLNTKIKVSFDWKHIWFLLTLFRNWNFTYIESAMNGDDTHACASDTQRRGFVGSPEALIWRNILKQVKAKAWL